MYLLIKLKIPFVFWIKISIDNFYLSTTRWNYLLDQCALKYSVIKFSETDYKKVNYQKFYKNLT